MSEIKQLLRRKMSELIDNTPEAEGFSIPEMADAMIEQDPELVEQINRGSGRRMLIAFLEKLAKAPADSGIKGAQAEMFEEALEACSGLQRCMSFKDEKGEVRYVPWYRATDNVIDRAVQYDDEQIEALQRKKVSKQQLKRLRTEHGVPAMIGWIDFKRGQITGGEAA